MITLDKLRLPKAGYTAHIDGNGGEAELVLCMSPSQAYQTALVAISCEVDGTTDVIADHRLSGKGKHASFPDADMYNFLVGLIASWAAKGIKPDAEQREELQRKAVEFAQKICKHFYFPIPKEAKRKK